MGLTILVGALVGLLKGFDELVAKARETVAGLSRPAPTDPSGSGTPAQAQPTRPPPPEDVEPMSKRVAGHANRPLFVAAPPGEDGTLIGARTRRVLAQEGFTLASDRSGAGLLVEIAPPVYGPARTLPSSGLAITSVAATLQATLTLGAGGASAAPPQQREVVGRGDGEDSARRDALSRASDQLGERIAATLRQDALPKATHDAEPQPTDTR